MMQRQALRICHYSACVVQDDQSAPVLIVDGYNVIMRRLALEAEAEGVSCPVMDVLREQLVNDTRDYALALNCRPIVVFDAYSNPSSVDTSRSGPHFSSQY
jgi:predicted RNA-binding protein with PIN domain